MSENIPRCEPTSEHTNWPYHWVQWRTPYRADPPEPWLWLPEERTWRTAWGLVHRSDRAAQLQWHYVAPAFPPTLNEDIHTQ